MKQFCIELMHSYGSCELELSNLQKDVKQEESESDAPDPAIRKESIVKAKEIKEELEKVLYQVFIDMAGHLKFRINGLFRFFSKANIEDWNDD